MRKTILNPTANWKEDFTYGRSSGVDIGKLRAKDRRKPKGKGSPVPRIKDVPATA